MTTYFADEALLPSGWATRARIDIDARGDIASVVANASEEGAERLRGPVLPGMANLHSHAFQRAMAGLAEVRGPDDDDFWTWRDWMYRFVLRLTPAQAEVIARQLYIEMLCHGYTAVAEFHYVHNDSEGRPYANRAEMLLRHLVAAREAGIAVTLLPSLYAWSNFGAKPLHPRQQRFASDPGAILGMIEIARAAAREDPDVHFGVAPHSLRAVDTAQLDELLAGLNALEPEAPVHIHAAEQVKEVKHCVKWSGKRPIEWLLARMPLDTRWCVVHATHMTNPETEGLARSGAVAGLCPTTEANLGDGIFPLLDYRAAGGRYGIGGDSHVSRNPADELRSLEYAQRLTARRRILVVRPDLHAAGTTLWLEAAAGGGWALGRSMGAIEPGMRGDLVVLDPEHPNLAGRAGDGVTNALIFGGGENLVRDVMVGGRWQVREGRHPGAAQAALQYRQAIEELLA
ncbi:MAG: formimidoylglutamate deiminase [Betaproteobacteria bacterium RIFCSPLOWO2_02_FULL_66_14]|nr:MAG: formimidoylglutamate deiminase [Betaproteobacteria bacterium RIFCSPLOWO2_02_FULL_66_14]